MTEVTQSEWDKIASCIEIDQMRTLRYSLGLSSINSLDRSSRILDVGCGQGSGLAMLQQAGFIDLFGVDVSAERIRRCREKLNPSTTVQSIDPEKPLPFPDEFFDCVVSFTVIEHATNSDFFVREISRVLKKGGRAIISSDGYSWRILQIFGLYQSSQPVDRALPLRRFIKLFRANNFDIIGMRTFSLPSRGAPLTYYSLKAWAEKFVRKLSFGKLNYRLCPTTEPTVAEVEKITNEGFMSFAKMYVTNIYADENIFVLRKKREVGLLQPSKS